MSKNKLSTLAKECIDTLFITKTLALEELNEPSIISKQLQLTDIYEEMLNWINSNPRGLFEIIVYDEKDYEPVTLTVTNCPTEDARNHYVITVNEDWTGFTAEQKSESGTHKTVLKVVEV